MIANFNHNHQKIFGASWEAVILHFLLYGGKRSGAVIQQSTGLTLVPKYTSVTLMPHNKCICTHLHSSSCHAKLKALPGCSKPGQKRPEQAGTVAPNCGTLLRFGNTE
jgi:hypothetical protein